VICCVEGQSPPGVPFVPVVVVAAFYSARLRRSGEASTPTPLILRREREPRNYGYALTGPARWNSRPKNCEADTQRGALLLKLLPHGLPNPARDV